MAAVKAAVKAAAAAGSLRQGRTTARMSGARQDNWRSSGVFGQRAAAGWAPPEPVEARGRGGPVVIPRRVTCWTPLAGRRNGSTRASGRR